MRIQVLTYPQRLGPGTKLFDGKVDPSQTIDEIVSDIRDANPNANIREDAMLIVDRNQNFHRITLDDPINRYFNGQLGEIYRITDGSAVRYRIVSPIVTMSKDKEKVKERNITPELFATVYENILTMLLERSRSDDVITQYAMPREQLISSFGDARGLTIPNLETNDQIIDSRGRALYVFFLGNDESTFIHSKSDRNFKEYIKVHMNNIIEQHNRINSADQMDPFDNFDNVKQVQQFASRFEILLIYNNPTDKAESDMHVKPKFYQTYPMQHLTLVVTHHVDQPRFELLNADHQDDLMEIRNIYAQNGRILKGDKTLESYALRDNVRLLLI